MSRSLGLDVINRRPTPRPGHTQYSLEYHVDLVRRYAGIQSGPTGVSKEASDYAIWDARTRRAIYDAWDFDFLWNTHDGLIDWGQAGRVTDMGHAVYASDGADQRAPHASPFESPEDVWAFDPATEYGFPDFDEQRRAYQTQYDQLRADFPNQLTGGGYYRSVVSGAIASFGWDMLLLAATRGLPGIMLAVGNHIPANVTDETCDRFLTYLREHWRTGSQ